MASDQFSRIQAKIVAALEKLKHTVDFGERKELFIELRMLIEELERHTQRKRR